MKIDYRPASDSDLSDIVKLLQNNDLPITDITNSDIQLFVGTYNNVLVGVIGIEIYSSTGLLRSLAVDDSFKKLNIGTTLINRLFNNSKLRNIKDVYLLTETAEKYFEKFNFQSIDRSNVPDIIMETQEFKEICPVSATVMHRNIVE